MPVVGGLRVELFHDDEAGNWHYRVPALHINGGGTATRKEAERDCLAAINFALQGEVTDAILAESAGRIAYGDRGRISGEGLSGGTYKTRAANRTCSPSPWPVSINAGRVSRPVGKLAIPGRTRPARSR